VLDILNTDQIRKADAETISRQSISSFDLMERAAQACTDWICENFDSSCRIAIISGPGNNGGDALAISRQLSKLGYSIRTFIVESGGDHSPDLQVNLERLKAENMELTFLRESHDVPPFESVELIIDGIFGSGLNRSVSGLAAAVIERINNVDATIVSIDVPSGLFADPAINPEGSIIHAAFTLSFQLPKLVFMMPSAGTYVGNWVLLDIELDQDFIAGQESVNKFVDDIHEFNQAFLRPRFGHKGTFGHALIVAGREGSMGACAMAARSALRAGVGLTTVFVPYESLTAIQTLVPEAMADWDMDSIHTKVASNAFSVIGIGPGLGQSPEAITLFKGVIKAQTEPIVLDADGINILANWDDGWNVLPVNSILTPHVKEFERLFGPSISDYQRFETLRSSAIERKVFILLKGAHSALATPDGVVYFNSTGNPGMATAGSGDVLTGIITGFLAQTSDPFISALCGMYIHGVAGDMAANENGMHGMLATDIIDRIGHAIDYSFSFAG